MNDLPDEQVLVKVSNCKKCTGIVRVAILHTMDAKSTGEFEREVKKHDLSVKTIPLLQYREEPPLWCRC